MVAAIRRTASVCVSSPEGWSRSLDAEGEAREWGVVLPDGFTFVRPHVRGGHDHDPAPVVAKARGLQTLSALL